jgi:hypothetical protein
MERPISLPASIKDLYNRAETAIQELQSIRNDIKAIQAAQGNTADVVKTENGKIPEKYLPSGIKPFPSWFTVENTRSKTSYGGVYPSVNTGHRSLNWYTNVADWNFDTDIILVNGAKIKGTVSNSDNVYGYDFPTLKSKILEGANLNGIPGNNTVTKDSIQNNAITTEKLADGSVTTEKILNGGITNEKFAANSVNTTNIVNNAITSDKLADDSVTRNKIVQNIDLRGPDVKVDGKKIATEEYVLAHQGGGGGGSFQLTNNCIETKHIKDDAITVTKIAANAVTTRALNPQSVTNEKLANNSVDINKLADDSVSSSKILQDIELRGTNVQANGGKIATETFVNDQLNSKLNLSGGTLTGPLTVQKLIVGNLEISVE